MADLPGLLRLFVYGTLQRGRAYHDRYCRGAVSVAPARVPGRLYDLPYGYPGLVLPPDLVLAVGSTDPEADMCLQDAWSSLPAPGLGWDTVYGELICFNDPRARLPALDELEDFVPDRPSPYRRVLAVVQPDGAAEMTAWLYVISEVGVGFRYLPEGRWPP